MSPARPSASSARASASIIALSVLPFVILAVLHWSYAPAIAAGDYAQYLLHADALAHGRPYGDIGYIYSSLTPFIGPRAQPPGLPLTILPLVAIGGMDSALLKPLMLLSGVSFLALVVLYFARRGELWGGVAAALFTGVALEAAYATNEVLSDLGFCALVWGAIYVADRQGAWTMRRAAVVTALVLVSISYRVAGIALLPALGLFSLMQPAAARRKALIALLALGVVFVIVVLALPGAAPFVDMVLANPTQFGRRLAYNFMKYRQAILEATIYPFRWNGVNDVYHVIAALLAAAGLVRLALEYWRTFLGCFTVAYGLMLFAAPVTEARYAWPLFPLIALAVFDGLRWLIIRIGRAAPARAAATACAVMALLALVGVTTQAMRPPPPSLVGQPDARALFTHIRELRRTTPVRVAFFNPRVLTLETGAPAMMLAVPSPERFISELREQRISHVVIGDLGQHPRLLARLRDAIATYPGAFLEVYGNDSFTVYAFRGGPESTSSLEHAPTRAP